jgi:TonB family protein
MDLAIGENGLPRGIKPQNPGDPVSEAAAQAVGSWRFQPGSTGGKPARASALIQFECVPSAPAAAPPDTQEGTHIKPAVAVFKAPPRYPEEAWLAAREATVKFDALIDSTGHVASLRVKKMAGLGLDEQAMEAVIQWRYKLAAPVAIKTDLEVSFRLKP